MKIAIPTADGKSIFAHFGKTPGVLIVSVENNQISNKKFIQNDFTGHAQGMYHEHNHNGNGHSNSPSQAASAHAGIFNAIGNCDVVISGGMGRRLYDEFVANNMEVFITQENDIDKAVNLYLNQKLDNNEDQTCQHD